MQDSREQWISLHQNNRYRPKYPSETVVQFVFRNFVRDGKTKVLDLGCGAGRHVFFMGKENIVPYGLDFSDEGIRYTKEMLIAQGMEQYVSNMQVGTLTALPYEDDFLMELFVTEVCTIWIGSQFKRQRVKCTVY